ncbi:MAG: PTS lactose/cellobiose transporter subunit IIA [Lachnospiraceae bacterium]|nr:PTS lactose/cellobiose transporter subunit IIA [Lachnospiraceae bacterium]
MEENRQLDEVVAVAMEILVDAGDARTCMKEALDAVMAGDSELCDEKVKEAKACMVKAHTAQTNMISREASGESVIYSMLLTHAQDTLMTINSEIHLGEKMIKMYRTLESKIVNR